MEMFLSSDDFPPLSELSTHPPHQPHPADVPELDTMSRTCFQWILCTLFDGIPSKPQTISLQTFPMDHFSVFGGLSLTLPHQSSPAYLRECNRISRTYC